MLIFVLCVFPAEQSQQDCEKQRPSVQPPCLRCSFLPIRENSSPLTDLLKWEFWTQLPIQLETQNLITRQPCAPLPFCFTSNENNLDENEYNMSILPNSCRQELHSQDRKVAWILSLLM